MPCVNRKPNAIPAAKITREVTNTRTISAINRPTRPDERWTGSVWNRLSRPESRSVRSPTALTTEPNIAPTSTIMGTVPKIDEYPVAAVMLSPSTMRNITRVSAG